MALLLGSLSLPVSLFLSPTLTNRNTNTQIATTLLFPTSAYFAFLFHFHFLFHFFTLPALQCPLNLSPKTEVEQVSSCLA